MLLGTPLAHATPVVYTVDPMHTYPSFEAPHLQGISFWRGKFDHTTGKVILDREHKTGHLQIDIDMSSVDFGLDIMNQRAKSAELLDVARYPTAHYESDSFTFKGDTPVTVNGRLTLLGVTKPVPLTIRSFKCIQHPFLNRTVCGADAYAEFNRGDFGMTHYIEYGPKVRLAIQVEALEGEAPPAPPPGPKPSMTSAPSGN